MNRRNFLRNTGIGAAGLTLGALPQNLYAWDDFATISILHTNDIHTHVEPFESSNPQYKGNGGLAKIAALAKSYRQKNPDTLLFDAGDMFQGTPYFNYFKGELIFKLMSEAGYNAGTIGNHEFDNGLNGILEPLPHAKFPLINSNYNFSDTILAGKFPRWKIFRQSGIKIGVYGLGIALSNLVSTTNIGNTIYNNPLKTALEMETFLKNDKKCDLVICLSHLGLRYNGNKISDMVIAAETSLTDLIIGGHTHTFLEQPIETKNKAGKPIIVNQAWWGGLVMGQIDFIFERNKKKKETVFATNLS
ncbi:5'-nucleotidase [Tangfeifania diversioriginum]|uniref:5'-nucleotidase n=1 Tax=Tangfeifania diversioriginum TaxID=1168035 RepID=A0A1M6FN15_9BACT|nr:metallophosphatase [Tangfeifania diversioriginum]SHI99148.1 5'-nucleotidase [Tangfeifania diversioriginum]